jgi:hypothetical protein
MCYVTRVTRRSRGRELGQEGMCNRVRDRYEDEVAHTLAHATRSCRCGCQLCKRHERSNMWYKRKLIKNTYSTKAYAGLTAMWDLPPFIVYHNDVMWPYYRCSSEWPQPSRFATKLHDLRKWTGFCLWPDSEAVTEGLGRHIWPCPPSPLPTIE